MKQGSVSWPLIAGFLALPTLLPLAASIASFARIDTELWSHLIEYVLPHVVPQTALILCVVSIGVSVLGTSLALLVSLFEFPGRRFFSWALILPLAIPGYVLATVFIGTLDYAGSVATILRQLGIPLPELRNSAGACLVLIAALYPYVYLVVRTSLASQGARVLEAARSMGLSPRQAVVRVALPLSAPAIIGGSLLAAMETLSDFGTVAAFNVDTLTTAIYKAWFSLFSVDAALQIAGILLLFVLCLIILQSRASAMARVDMSGPNAAPHRLRGTAARSASLFCSLILLLCLGLPVMQLVLWSLEYLSRADQRLIAAAKNSVSLGALAALLLGVAALILAYAIRRNPGRLTRMAMRTATLGYALPGALLAVGLFVPLAAMASVFNATFSLNIILQGGIGLMLLAYLVRFTAVAYAPIATGLAKIKPSLDEAARLAGHGALAQVSKVHLPLLRPGLAAACALVFVDVMKEMPITLMMRPFGWDTLAIRVFELTSEGEWEQAALPSLLIVIVGLLPVWLLVRNMDQRENKLHGPAT